MENLTDHEQSLVTRWRAQGTDEAIIACMLRAQRRAQRPRRQRFNPNKGMRSSSWAGLNSMRRRSA